MLIIIIIIITKRKKKENEQFVSSRNSSLLWRNFSPPLSFSRERFKRDVTPPSLIFSRNSTRYQFLHSLPRFEGIGRSIESRRIAKPLLVHWQRPRANVCSPSQTRNKLYSRERAFALVPRMLNYFRDTNLASARGENYSPPSHNRVTIIFDFSPLLDLKFTHHARNPWRP